ncbi:MAG: sterol desaturase family protein [Desulfovibrionaceae bacterium]|nr:sterol desaturase family protein [Desulfovibrionaceae bacterium]
MPSEALIRLVFFLSVAAVLAAGEALRPKLPPPAGARRRWLGNLGVSAVSVACTWLFPVLPVAAAVWAGGRGVGLLNVVVLPGALSFLLASAALDLAIYLQHRAMHALRPLWLLHRAHHADVFFDFTTAVRFHPLEIMLSTAYKLALVAALGPSPVAVLAFEIMLNCLPMFNHSNLRLPGRCDRVLRLLLVTPDMHRVHHSADMREANANFGFNFPWWDRLFGTYLARPAKGCEGMRIGLNILREARYSSLGGILAIPFVSSSGAAVRPHK